MSYKNQITEQTTDCKLRFVVQRVDTCKHSSNINRLSVLILFSDAYTGANL
jgi:hypothetical protein